MKPFKWFLQSKNDRPKSEEDYMRGFDSGFNLGLSMASTLDKQVKDKLYSMALDEALERFNANKKTH